MRKGFKVLCSVMLALVFMFGTTVDIIADDSVVAVEVTTDKESYDTDEEVLVTVTVTNTSEEEVSNLNVKVNWPEGLTYASEEGAVVVVDTLAAGESQKFEIAGKKSESMPTAIIMVVLAVIIVALVVFFIIGMKKNKKAASAATVAMAVLITMIPVSVVEAGETQNVETVVEFGGKEVTIGASVTYSLYHMTRISHVTVHDPSVVYDPETDMYYIFGSHRAWAKSEDLINWTIFQNNINTDYNTIFANEIKWAAKGGTQGNPTYQVAGNLWAPDVIYNEAMGKWTMYMSVNGDKWYSSIVLLTADSPEGDWTYVGPVVYSGFSNKADAEETDFYDVYTGSDFPSRYTEKRNGNLTYGMNAIDPCVFYDQEGCLWMAYGSWFGGIYMIELDPETGLRLASHTYETVENASDEYQGIKIAGGSVVSGEGAYIEYINGYYYLYISYGGLTATGGYNVRVFRSENPDGPYLDLSGDSPLSTYGWDNINADVGVRVMGNYQWDYINNGQIAQGHNSVFSSEDGIFTVYHTRFTNQGEGHAVRVHQQFVNEDGWLVTAPFEYAGEALSYVEKEDVVGDYKIIIHNLKVNYSGKQCNTTVNLSLNEDGTVSGKLSGTWSFSKAMGAPYVTMVLDGVEYNGVFVEQRMENSSNMAMTFTVLGDDELNIWGYDQIEAE